MAAAGTPDAKPATEPSAEPTAQPTADESVDFSKIAKVLTKMLGNGPMDMGESYLRINLNAATTKELEDFIRKLRPSASFLTLKKSPGTHYVLFPECFDKAGFEVYSASLWKFCDEAFEQGNCLGARMLIADLDKQSQFATRAEAALIRDCRAATGCGKFRIIRDGDSVWRLETETIEELLKQAPWRSIGQDIPRVSPFVEFCVVEGLVSGEDVKGFVDQLAPLEGLFRQIRLASDREGMPKAAPARMFINALAAARDAASN